jgi:hypothetical protein
MAMVIFSLIAPSVVPFFQTEQDTVLSVDLTEEENKKDSSNELEEKNVYFERLTIYPSPEMEISPSVTIFYHADLSDHMDEIILPPPEHKG